MNFDAMLLAHGDIGIPNGVLELLMATLLIWIITGLFAAVNLALILGLRTHSASKWKHLQWWALYAVMWTIFTLGVTGGQPDFGPFIIIALAIPVATLAHFVILNKLRRGSS